MWLSAPGGSGPKVATKKGRPQGDPSEKSAGSARFAVLGVVSAVGAELLQREPVGGVPAVLLGDVVAMLANRARQRDLGANICCSLSHVNPSFNDHAGMALCPVYAAVENWPNDI
jgi:hypothetical protein